MMEPTGAEARRPAPDGRGRFTVQGRTSGRLHFIGIGGAGMSSLARILAEAGFTITGSDLARSATTDDLQRQGWEVSIGHDVGLLARARPHLVVVTSALNEADREVAWARQHDVPVVKRARLLGQLMAQRQGVAVAGTHGKTTTTALVASLLTKAGRDPTVMIGGESLDLGSGARLGAGEAFVAEADEFDRSFLEQHPDVAIVTSADPDHLDYYGSVAAMEAAFTQFMAQVRPGGVVVACADQAPLRRLLGGVRARVETYGLHQPAHWQAAGARATPRGMAFELLRDGASLGQFEVSAYGEHNVANAVAALAACAATGAEPEALRPHLATFRGTRRRFEIVATPDQARGVTIMDDYAHHPAEVRATLRAARGAGFRPICAIFQPHTLDRTRYLLEAFLQSFGDAECVVITDTYSPPGRERGTGITSADLARRLAAIHPRALHAATLEDAARTAASVVEAWAGPHPSPHLQREGAGTVSRGALLLTMGAGDVWRAARLAQQRLA